MNEISAGRRFYWSVRRELWEYRSLWISPLGMAGIVIIGFLVSTMHLQKQMRAALSLDAMKRQMLVEQPYDVVALLIMVVAFIVTIFYCLDALQSERRDRSILFWKSLPVSDLTTVLAKTSIPLVIMPLISFAVTAVVYALMFVLSSIALAGSDVGVAALWSNLSIVQWSIALLYHLLAIHGFWYAPIWAWLLFASAWARRAALLWALLPLFAIGIFEKIAFNTSYFGHLLMHRISGGGDPKGGMQMASMTPMPGDLLLSPGLWLGFIVAAVLLAAAVQLRRQRGPV